MVRPSGSGRKKEKMKGDDMWLLELSKLLFPVYL
jgi:hypothetical protein